MSQISFSSILMQESQIFVTDFGNTIDLTPGIAATHIPLSIYNYTDTNFIKWLCTEPDRLEVGVAVPLYSCQCTGNNYHGMPDIDFVLNVDMYETGYSYGMNPAQYEMSPTVNME